MTGPGTSSETPNDVRLSTILSLFTDFISRVGIPVALAIFLLWQQNTTLTALTSRCDINSITLTTLRNDFDSLQRRLDGPR